MNSSILEFSFGKKTSFYFDLLKEEDFDFKTKDIKIDLSISDEKLKIKITANCLIDSKIGISSVLKSLEIIQKTLEA